MASPYTDGGFLWATVITGTIILLTDLHSSLAILFEVRGIAILIKITLLLLIPVFWEQRVTLLICVLLIGAISSHLPKRYRHKVFIIHDDIHSDHRSGYRKTRADQVIPTGNGI